MTAVPEASAVAPRQRGRPSRVLRRLRVAVLVVATLVLLCLGYLNQVGLPDWAKQALLGKVAERGIDLDFSRIRVRFGRGLVAENVLLRLTGKDRGEEFRADGLHLKLRWADLLSLGAPELIGIRLLNGRVLLPLEDTGGEPQPPLLFEGVRAHLEFVDSTTWRLEEFRARTRGMTFETTGMLRQVSALRNRRRDRPRSAAWEAVRRRLNGVVHELRASEFGSEPALTLRFDVDFLNPERTVGEFGLVAAGVSTRFGRLEAAEFRLRLNEPRPVPGEIRLDLSLRSSRAVADEVEAASLDLDAGLRHRMTNAVPSEWYLRTTAVGVASRWGRAGNLALSVSSADVPRPAGEPVLDLTRWWGEPLRERWTNLTTLPAGDLTARINLQEAEFPVGEQVVSLDGLGIGLDARHDVAGWYGGRFDVAATNLVTAWGRGEALRVTLEARPRPDPPLPGDEWGPWRWVAPVVAEIGLHLEGVRVPRPDPDHEGEQVELGLAAADLALGWRGPTLEIRRMDASLAGGALGAEGHLDVPSRRVELDATSSVDVHRLEALLTEPARRWIRQFGWSPEDPPRVRADLGVILPAWDDRKPDWRGEVVPTLTLAGQVRGNAFSFRGIRGDAASGTFTYTNRFWDLPRMEVVAPEGELAFRYLGDERTKDFRFQIESRMDPRLARPLVEDPRADQIFGAVQFGVPPVLRGEVWGRWKEPERIAADLRVALTNVVIRGEPLEAATGRVRYTNGVALFDGVEVRSDGHATIPAAAYDIRASLLSFTNAFSTLPVTRVTRIIGPSATRVMDPFTFRSPPRVRVDGVVPVRDVPGADIRFDAEVPDAAWWRLRGSNITTRVMLQGDILTLTGLRSEMLGGTVDADVRLDLTDGPNPLVRFEAAVTNARLSRIVAELFERTNSLEGQVTGRLSILDSRSLDTNSWNGGGDFSMRDGFLWGIPLFGLFSPLFDAMAPGLGETRFHSGTLGFTLTNSIVKTRDLRLHSPAMRLDYRGSVGLDGQLDAFMEARLLRDTPVLGPILNVALSPVTKLLEYRVTGSLGKPVAEPRYIPSFLLKILQPIRTLRSLLPDEASPAVVESPAEPPAEPAPAPDPR